MPRRAPAAVAHNGYLYIVGGIDGNGHYVQPVEYAPILENGTLGKWQRTSPIIEGRFYNAVVAFNGYLYTLGGGSGAPIGDLGGSGLELIALALIAGAIAYKPLKQSLFRQS